MTFKNILIAIDRTPNANLVFDQGASIAKKYDAHLTLVHCVDEANILATATATAPAGVGLSWTGSALPPGSNALGTDPSQDVIFREHLDRQQEMADTWLQGFQQKAYDVGCNDVTYTLRTGRPDKCICTVAEELGADLVVVGRRDRSGLEKLLLGSVSSDVVNHASCTVMVVQQ